jgi:hypothetical protein
MANETEKSLNWGGAREGAGRPAGRTKKKICVSVNESVWQSALRLWRGKGSPLVEKLLTAYVENADDNKQRLPLEAYD